MNESKPLRFAELVLKPCSLEYGTAPCTAALGVTGDFKCYNSPRTCQDPANYTEGAEQIIRWAMPTSDLPVDIEAMPCITSISRRPLRIDVGESLGVRESVTVTMHNFKHNDVGFDNYIDDRGFNTYSKGTYWGKFSARWGSLEGYEFRTVDGHVGQDIDDMTRRYYMIDKTTGPDAAGNFSFTAKDAMKFADSDKAQWPLPSEGVLASSLSDTATSLTLEPAGIGDLYYPASGVASIGDEKVTFTRAGDVITLTGRGLSGSEQDSHDAGETFQIAAVFTAQDPAAIIRDILQDATQLPSEYIDYNTWKTEVDDHLGRLYSAEIMQPTPVKDLIEELQREAGLTIFADLVNKKIVVKVLRSEVPVTSLNDDFFLAGTIASKQLVSKRVSDIWVYYAKYNPLEDQDEKKNFRAIYAKPSANPVAALENNPRAIREIMSRWITVFNQPAAVSVADRIISRYETIPREVSFKVPERFPLSLSSVVNIKSRIFENSQGDEADYFPCQITSIETKEGIHTAIAEEVILSAIDPPDPLLRIININANTLNVNLKTIHDSIYTPIVESATVRLIIASDVTIGSGSISNASLTIGDWPASVTIEIDGTGRIFGKGGDASFSSSLDGGTALYTRRAIDIIGDLDIWGGGGAGGYNYSFSQGMDVLGGGGAGYLEGQGEAGSDHPSGGSAGQNGDDGADEDSNIVFGGGSGYAIDGLSFVTKTGTLDIRGDEVN